MNPLLNTRQGSLYLLDSTFLSHIRYSSESPGSAVFFFNDEPAEEYLSQQVFLVPDDEKENYSSYLYTLSDKVTPYDVPAIDLTYYMVDATTDDAPALREDLRVNITYDTMADFDGYKDKVPITLRDISAGGFLFTSEKEWEVNTTLSFAFTLTKVPVYIAAKIRYLRPTPFSGLYSYGCQFIGLPKDTEAIVRNFVFSENVLQKRRAENS